MLSTFLAIALLLQRHPFGDLKGNVTIAHGLATYTDQARQFSIAVSKDWWLRDAWIHDSGPPWQGEPMVGGGGGVTTKDTWDPQFIVFKMKLAPLESRLKPWQPHEGRGPQFLASGKTGRIPYIAWWELGWTYVAGYVNSRDATWRIEIHIPKATWKKQLPLAERIIASFKFLK